VGPLILELSSLYSPNDVAALISRDPFRNMRYGWSCVFQSANSEGGDDCGEANDAKTAMAILFLATFLLPMACHRLAQRLRGVGILFVSFSLVVAVCGSYCMAFAPFYLSYTAGAAESWRLSTYFALAFMIIGLGGLLHRASMHAESNLPQVVDRRDGKGTLSIDEKVRSTFDVWSEFLEAQQTIRKRRKLPARSPDGDIAVSGSRAESKDNKGRPAPRPGDTPRLPPDFY